MEPIVRIFNMSCLYDDELLNKYLDGAKDIEFCNDRYEANYIYMPIPNPEVMEAVEERNRIYEHLGRIGAESIDTPFAQSVYETIKVMMVDMPPQIIYNNPEELKEAVEELRNYIKPLEEEIMDQGDDWDVD